MKEKRKSRSTPTNEPAPSLAFGVPDAARSAGISRATLYNLWREGGGPRRARVRGRVVVTRESLQEWLRSLEEASA
jgi:predicted DNA-binding transcriptional regulator AlpA